MAKIKKLKNGISCCENFLLDLFFPKACLLCDQDGVFLCKNCLKKIKINSLQVCPICEKFITEGGETCPNCQNKESAIDQMVIAADYQKPEMAEIIHCYKYKFVQDLHQPLGKLLVSALIKNKIFTPDFVVPVPLHPSRLRWRGFNQAESLADYIGKNLLPGMKIPVLNNLVQRIRKTPSQMKIKKYAERQKNLENAFALNKKNIISHSFPGKERAETKFENKSKYERTYVRTYSKNKKAANNPLPLDKKDLPASKAGTGKDFIDVEYFKNKKFLIVDDVCTTGSTIFECAKILQQLKPTKISAIVLGRQKC